jgi:hypothetical protein
VFFHGTAARLIGAGLLAASALTSAHAELTAAQQKHLARYAQAIDRLSPAQRSLLSSGAQNLYKLAKSIQAGAAGSTAHIAALPDTNLREHVPLSVQQALNAQLAPGVVHVSDPARDYTLSVDAGFTQSETSTAWCGDSIVTGYNDSGAFLRTNAITAGATSFNGVAVSADAGHSFRSLEYLNPGTDPGNFLEGDPVVGCASSQQFYYSSLLSNYNSNGPTFTTAVSISVSSDGGMLWSSPSYAAAKDAYFHTLDKDWMTVNPAHPQDLYVTYTDFDASGNAPCNGGYRTAIEMVRSTDGGNSWSQPVVVEQYCQDEYGFGNTVQGSQVIVDKWGHVLVAYEVYFTDGTRALQIARSTNGGASFSKSVLVSKVVPTGDGNILQAGFRTNEFPSLASDPRTGEIYVAWADGRNHRIPDFYVALFGGPGTYNFGDVLVSHSTNDGSSWSAPAVVSPQSPNYPGVARDQFMPGIAVDKTGKVAVCYYDRRNDPDNQSIDRYCSVSSDAGSGWSDERQTVESWTPVQSSDQLIAFTYMGDYDTTVTDVLGQYTGFAGAFQIQTHGNPDVYLARF